MVNPGKSINKILRDKYSPVTGSWTGKHKNSTNLSGFWKGVIPVKEIFALDNDLYSWEWLQNQLAERWMGEGGIHVSCTTI